MKIRIIKTLPELEAVRPSWEKWQNHINHDFDHFKLVCQIRSEIESPFVAVIEDHNQQHAVLVGRLERTEFSPPIGYLKPVKISAKVITIIHQGLLGDLDAEAANYCIQSFQSLLRSGIADAIEFYHLSENSPLLQSLLAKRSRWLCEMRLKWSTHREMTIPGGGGFMQQKVSAKHRSSIRKKQRELEAAYPGKIAWRWMSRFDDVPGLCAKLEEAAARTYQRGLRSGFFNNEEFRQRFDLFARQGQLRVQLLEIDEKVKAFWFGTVYKGVFNSSETGYDPDLRRYEVGTQLFIRMVDELAREGVKSLDFGIGDAGYKQRFSDRSWRETTVWIFAPTAKGLAMGATGKLFKLLDSAGRRILDRARLSDRLKNIWRRRLSKGETEIGKT